MGRTQRPGHAPAGRAPDTLHEGLVALVLAGKPVELGGELRESRIVLCDHLQQLAARAFRPANGIVARALQLHDARKQLPPVQERLDQLATVAPGYLDLGRPAVQMSDRVLLDPPQEALL